MIGFDAINYSLRPNKAIQRSIVFDGLELLARCIPVSISKYIGFGSIWFSDFIVAHKRLGIIDMVSIERDPIEACRAIYNAPFSTVVVKEGDSSIVLRSLVDNKTDQESPWTLWLDYTDPLTPEVISDLDLLIDNAPSESVVILTVNAHARSYGKGLQERLENVRSMLGDVLPEDIDPSEFESGRLVYTIGRYLSAYIDARCKTFARSPGFVPCFNIPYRDGAPMITLGGVLVSDASVASVTELVGSDQWPGCPPVPVETPPLTSKEVSSIQKLLPSAVAINRAAIQGLGFDLEEAQLEVYCAHYRRYPMFFQAAG